MGSDCTLPIDDGFVNIRVGAIIMKGDRFLVVGNETESYLYSVGGRIRFGETAEDAVVREVYEETGVHLTVNRLGFIHENYFYGDYGDKKGKLIYEISFYFYMNVPDDFAPVCTSVTSLGKERLVWVTADSDIPFFPEFYRTELKDPSAGVKHIVTDERKRA